MSRTFARFADRADSARTRTRRRARRPGLEALEQRLALSLGSEFGVFAGPFDGYNSANASSSNGMSVAIYSHTTSTLGGRPLDVDVTAQVYDASGHAVGKPFGVAGGSPGSSDGTSVSQVTAAMDPTGRVLTAWTLTRSSGPSLVGVSLRDRNGTLLADNTITDGPHNVSEPSVAVAANGSFVVSYTDQYGDFAHNAVYARMYNAAGKSVRTVAVATDHGANQRESKVAAAPDGRFDVAYQYAAGSGPWSIRATAYTASGAVRFSTVLATAPTGALEYYPAVAVDNSGNAVVAWYEVGKGGARNVYARTLSASGVRGSTTAVTSGSGQNLMPAVAVNGKTGAFVVAYQSGFGNPEVRVAEFSRTGSLRASFSAGTQRHNASLSIDGNGNYMLTYTKDTPSPAKVYGRWGHLA